MEKQLNHDGSKRQGEILFFYLALLNKKLKSIYRQSQN